MMGLSAGFLSLPMGMEWWIILLVVILVFGPKNLPKLGSAIGKFSRNLRAGKGGEEIEDDTDLEEEEAPPPKPRRKAEE